MLSPKTYEKNAQMNNLTISGIQDGNSLDDRITIFLTVEHNGEIFDWFVKQPKSHTGTYQEYVDLVANSVYTDIESKLQAWNDLEPKTLSVTDPLTGETTVVTRERSEIVKPTYPDYYVLRAQEYPNVNEQMDSFWKGGNAMEEMQELIAAVKLKYPKP
jgi:hypothetical protein